MLQEIVLSGVRPTVPEHIPKDYSDLMEVCWGGDATMRPQFDVIQASLAKMAGPYYSLGNTTL